MLKLERGQYHGGGHDGHGRFDRIGSGVKDIFLFLFENLL